MTLAFQCSSIWVYTLCCCRHPPTVLSPNARYDKVLAAFGGNGYFVNTPEEIQKAMRESMACTKQASMVNIMINTMADRRAQVKIFIWLLCNFCFHVWKSWKIDHITLIISFVLMLYFFFNFGLGLKSPCLDLCLFLKFFWLNAWVNY